MSDSMSVWAILYVASIFFGLSIAKRRRRWGLVLIVIIFPFIGVLIALGSGARCPYCHNYIAAGEKICPFCKHDFAVENTCPQGPRVALAENAPSQGLVQSLGSFVHGLMNVLGTVCLLMVVMLAVILFGFQYWRYKIEAARHAEVVQKASRSVNKPTKTLRAEGKAPVVRNPGAPQPENRSPNVPKAAGKWVNALNGSVENLKATGRVADALKEGDAGAALKAGGDLFKKSAESLKENVELLDAVGAKLQNASPETGTTVKRLGKTLDNSLQTLKATGKMADALKEGDAGAALEAGGEILKKGVENLKDNADLLESAGSLIKGLFD